MGDIVVLYPINTQIWVNQHEISQEFISAETGKLEGTNMWVFSDELN